MMRLSVIIITKNEEITLSDCIKSVSFANEVIVIDNDSVDQTKKIAQKLRAKVETYSGLNFSSIRIKGSEKASGDWLLYLDADERVSTESKSEIMKILQANTKFAGFYIPRKNYYFNSLWPKREKMIRLMKKKSLISWQGELHETAIISGLVGDLHAPILHFTHSNLARMIEKTNEWSKIEADLRFKNNHPKIAWWRFFRVMITSFWHSYIKEGGWRVGTVGIIESIYQAFSTFITYAKLWEMQQNKSFSK